LIRNRSADIAAPRNGGDAAARSREFIRGSRPRRVLLEMDEKMPKGTKITLAERIERAAANTAGRWLAF
jgi:hypothetical protein